jgi:hypothetical protein
MTLEEVTLLNESRILRDNNLYLREKEEEKKSNRKSRGKGSRANFNRASEPSESAPSGKKGGALDAEQALSAFNAGVWKK